MSDTYNPNLVPMMISASTSQKLELLMQLNNSINAKNYNYMNPIPMGKKWVVWYYGDIFQDQRPAEKDIDHFFVGRERVEIK